MANEWRMNGECLPFAFLHKIDRKPHYSWLRRILLCIKVETFALNRHCSREHVRERTRPKGYLAIKCYPFLRAASLRTIIVEITLHFFNTKDPFKEPNMLASCKPA